MFAPLFLFSHSGSNEMRAEVESAVNDIQQAMSLLRRHL